MYIKFIVDKNKTRNRLSVNTKFFKHQIDWYLVSSFLVALITIMARSVGNLISYFSELQHAKEVIVNKDQKEFD